MSTIGKELPAEKVRELKDEGLSDEDIIKALQPSYSNQDIHDTMNQAGQDIPEDNILEELDKTTPDFPEAHDANEGLLEEAPAPEDNNDELLESSQQNYPNYSVQSSMSSDQIQEVVEAIIDEKWDDLTSKVGDLNLWKESMNNDIEAVKQELLRTQERLHNLQNVIIGKVTDYSKNINDISIEMKALEQVFQRILQPLTSNIKELNKVTEELKQHKRHKPEIIKEHKKKKDKK